MVAKISTGKDLYGALAYNQTKVEEGHAKILDANLLPYPEDGHFRMGGVMEAFTAWLPSHYRTEKPVIHISLNPHPDDVLTDGQLAAIGREYMEKLGYGNQPFLIFKHEDIDRHHIHIVSLRVDSGGRKISDRFEHRRSKEITEQLEQMYGLHPAKGQKKAEDWKLRPVDAGRGDIRRQIADTVKPLLKLYRFRSMGEFRALLSLYNIGMEEVRGEAGGRAYHGIVYTQKFGKLAYITKATAQLMRDLGSIQSPQNAFLLNIGLETLALRMERHCANAKKAAEYLKNHEKVAWVEAPGLPGDKYYDLAQKYLPNGTCGVIAFGVKGGREAAVRMMDALKMIAIVTHVADARSCVLHPASHTHRQMNDEELLEAGVQPDLIRFSVGLENIEDIIADLEQALRQV